MKKVDIKSFLIGVLITTNLFFFMGFSSTTKSVELYDNDDIMREVKKIKSTLDEDILKILKYIRSETIDIDRWTRMNLIEERIGNDGLMGRETVFKKLNSIESDLSSIQLNIYEILLDE